MCFTQTVFNWSSPLYKSKRRLVQTKYHWKKAAAAKNFFLRCVCYRCNLLRWMFFVPCDNWKLLFFLKVCRYCDIFSTVILSFYLKQVFWKKSLFYVTSTISAVLILMLMLSSKIKLSYTILIQNWKAFLADLFYDNVLHILYFLTIPP